MDFLAALPAAESAILPWDYPWRDTRDAGMRGTIPGLFTWKKMLKLKQQHSHPLIVMPLEPRAGFFLPPDGMNCPSRLEGPRDMLARRFGTLGTL